MMICHKIQIDSRESPRSLGESYYDSRESPRNLHESPRKSGANPNFYKGKLWT